MGLRRGRRRVRGGGNGRQQATFLTQRSRSRGGIGAALVNVSMFDDVAADGRGPLALVVDLGVEADGGDDGAGGGADGFGLLDEVFEGGAERGAALGAKAGGVGVAVNDGMMGDFVFVGDFLGAEPAEVILVNELAVGVMANGAFAGVSGDVCASGASSGLLALVVCR